MDRMKFPDKFPYRLLILLVLAEVLTLCLEKIVVLKASGESIDFYLSIMLKPWLWLVLIMSGVQLLLWVRILKKTALSLAYTVSSISVPLTMFAAWICFGESLSWHVWLGAFLISIGIILIGPDEEPGHHPTIYEKDSRTEGTSQNPI